ncbi:hypothetical protein ACVWYN_002485 [Pedobacter sp. UYP24]
MFKNPFCSEGSAEGNFVIHNRLVIPRIRGIWILRCALNDKAIVNDKEVVNDKVALKALVVQPQ